jgi:hypothetical protein
VKVLLQLGRRFAGQAGFSERLLDLPAGATVEAFLRRASQEAPSLECVGGGTVDLAVASLSVNGKAVDPRDGLWRPLMDGDRCYLYGAVSGG